MKPVEGLTVDQHIRHGAQGYPHSQHIGKHIPFKPIAERLAVVLHGAYRHDYTYSEHHDHGIVCVLPPVVPCKPGSHHIAGLRDDEYVEIEQRHQHGAFPLKTILYVGRGLLGHGEHGQGIHARDIGRYGKCAVEHHYDADYPCEKTCTQHHRQGCRDGTAQIQDNQESETPDVCLPDTPRLKETHHEGWEKAHPDAGEDGGKLYVFRPHACRPGHLADIAQICSSRECRGHKHEEQYQDSERARYPVMKRGIAPMLSHGCPASRLPSPHTSFPPRHLYRSARQNQS